MPKKIAGISEDELLEWIHSSIRDRRNILSHGYQGHIYIFDRNGQRLVIKAAMGWGLGKLIRRWMLHHEYRVYSRLSGIDGVPACHGFIQKLYLVLEFVDGASIRHARIENRVFFFRTLRNLIEEIHAVGVAHGDLKKKDNILVLQGRRPCLIDFGVAVIRKKGFAPLNHYLYVLFQRFDYNAWAKFKYNRKFEDMSEEDQQYYHRTVIERAAGWIKNNYTRGKRILTGK